MTGREAIFFHKGRSYKFAVEDEAPEQTTFTRRDCATGPVERLNLRLMCIDSERGTAIYRVIQTNN
jgi:hypothetical protein